MSVDALETSTLDFDPDALREKYRSNELDRVLTWSTACGVFLSRLALKYPDKIKHKSGVNHVRTWEIDIGGQH